MTKKQIMKQEVNSSIARGRECVICKHVYMKPCDGKNKDCQNLKWKPSKEIQKPKRKRVRL